MAKISTDELLDAFKEMTLIELSEFVKQFEDTFGVTAAAPVAVAAAPGTAASRLSRRVFSATGLSVWTRQLAALVASGLPLVTKPMLVRLKLMRDAFQKMEAGAPFIQFTYSVAPPIPKSLPGVHTQASERIWMNLPPARVWVYRKG